MSAIENEQSLPLSSAQLAIWLDLQVHPGNPCRYNIATYVDIAGTMHVENFFRAVRMVVAATSALRLRLDGNDAGRPAQWIARDCAVDLPLIDVSDHDDPVGAARTWMTSSLRTPFDLRRGPLFQFALIKVSSQRFYWYSKYHHIAVDGYSMAVVRNTITATYERLSRGDCTRLPDSDGYRQGLQDEADYRSSPESQQDQAYWAALHAGPCDSLRLSSKTATGTEMDSVGLLLSNRRVEALHGIAARLGIELAHLLIAIIFAYLHRATGMREIAVGLPAHGRLPGPMRNLVGMFTNVLSLRCRLDPEEQFESFARRVHEEVRQARAHQRYRHEDLRRDLGLQPGDPDRHQVLVNVMRFAGGLGFSLGAATARVHILAIGPVHDISFVLYGRGDRGDLLVQLDASASLHRHWMLESRKQSVSNLIEGIVAAPNARLRDYGLLTPAQRDALLSGCNSVDDAGCRDSFLHTFIEDLSQRIPDAVAVEFADQRLTYHELNTRSNKVAHFLGSKGIDPGAVVGLCMERCAEAIVGLIGIMKAGAAYLPLDPDIPRSRLLHMVTDAATSIVLTQERLLSQLQALDSSCACYPLDMQLMDDFPDHAADVRLSEKHLAYVMYTSGSTGEPKGVLIEHAGLTNLVRAQARIFGVQEGTRVLQFARLGFDASIWEIAMALGAGGTLCIADPFSSTQSVDLRTMIADRRIHVATLPPSVLEMLGDRALPSLHTLIAAGESCSVELARAWSRRCRFINAYGPTETTVCASLGEYSSDADSVPIGRALTHVEIYVLDESLQLAAPADIREIYIGGIGLARGYLNQPELTASRFIAHPFRQDGEARLYRSGDLGRYLPDGRIEFIGRADRQVKIRGLRIELGEVEAELRAHPSVSECAVAIRGEAERSRLVAYLVAAPGQPQLLSKVLRAHVRARLPGYMTPAHFVWLSALPLNVNGKLDLGALPDPRRSSRKRPPPVAPRSETEERLAVVWCDTLQIKNVGIDDDFFELGGDSLIAVQMLAQAREGFSVEVDMQSLLEASTVRTLAARIDELSGAQAPTNIGPGAEAWQRLIDF